MRRYRLGFSALEGLFGLRGWQITYIAEANSTGGNRGNHILCAHGSASKRNPSPLRKAIGSSPQSSNAAFHGGGTQNDQSARPYYPT